MDISFILSDDELFTLLSLFSESSGEGRHFIAQALPNAQQCDLGALADKKLAKLINDQLEIEPVVLMVIDAIARSDSAEMKDDIWNIHSPWISITCEKDPHNENHWKLTPVEEFGIRNSELGIRN